jgi:hypothetical protein
LSLGTNSIFYTLSFDKELNLDELSSPSNSPYKYKFNKSILHKSEKTNNSLKFPHWKETFNMPLDTGKEQFYFSIFIHNSNGDSLID